MKKYILIVFFLIFSLFASNSFASDVVVEQNQEKQPYHSKTMGELVESFYATTGIKALFQPQEGVKDAKGTSMMEDYTYNFVPGKEGILQSHMLEVCPSVADGKIGIKVCPLSMGDREDPARLVFTSKTGPGIATSLIDLGDRFRLIINDVECKKVEKPMPKLPVGSAFWTPQPNLKTGAEAWILAGGAHHTAFSYDLTAEQMGDWAAAMGIEAVYIDKDTNIRDFKNELRWNELAFRK